MNFNNKSNNVKTDFLLISMNSIHAVSLLVLLLIMIYIMRNDSGHTGFDLRKLLVPGVILMGTGFLFSIFGRQDNCGRKAFSLIVVGFWYAFVPFILEYSSIINVYDRWVKLGLPTPPQHKVLIVVGMIAAITVSTIFPCYAGKTLKLKEKGNHE